MYDPGGLLAELKQTLTRDRLSIAMLLGAGCPVAVSVKDDDKPRSLIPDIAGLSTEVREHIAKDVAYKASFGTVLEQFMKDGNERPTVEQLLTRIRSLREIAGSQSIVGISGDQLERLDNLITEHISLVVGKNLPDAPNAYHCVAKWIVGIPRHVPFELYTTNYDTLLEQALDVNKVPYFDGFVGVKHPFFDPISIESDIFAPRWARLWKIHGSINWWQVAINGKDRIVRADSVQGGKRRLIHPSHLKYEESRRMPYLSLIDRFRKFVSNGPSALVVCGFSFRDDHINENLNQALEANPNSVCFALMHGPLAEYQEACEIAKRLPNLNLLARDRAIINSDEASWMVAQGGDTRAIEPFCDIKRKEDKTIERVDFLLGDFDRFGRLLSLLAPERAR